MLKQLVEYAKDHLPGSEPGFTTKTVKWAIVFASSGDGLSVVELGDTTAKRNPGREFTRCPEMGFSQMKAGGVTKSHFLIDTTEVVALLGDKAQDPKNLAKHAYFLYLLRQASAVLPELENVADYLDDPASLQQVQERLAEQKAKPNEKVTFRIGGAFPVESTAWYDWWRSFRKTLSGGSANGAKRRSAGDSSMRSFVSGELTSPAPTHPKITGLADVGGSSMGSPLIGFDKDAFTSYGLSQSANCAVSVEDATAYRDALNDLLAKHSERLAGAKVAYWFAKPVADEDNPVQMLTNPAENGEDSPAAKRQAQQQRREEANAQHRAHELLTAIRDGERPDLADNRYNALTLSGAAGRVMVRDWMEGSFAELVENIAAWFDDLAIVHRAGGNALAPCPKFLAVLSATVRELDDLAAPMVSRVWRSALHCEPIPRSAHAQALARVRLDILNDAVPNHARMGLLRAYHLRAHRSKGDDVMAQALKPYLNEEHPSLAYHCGRLMAVYAALQHAALGDVGAGVVQRYYAAASATPALVLGRLARSSQFHLNKLEGGLTYWYESALSQIWSRLGDGAPRTLDLEEQSLFALGYYQQLADLRTKKTDDKAADTTTNPKGDD
ncbi:type I-C CRISPR-associated protein Cas8c/Csd1 [bacterium]|nr:type I-C CRISPR-associated protein Cas8c/Csd1 [bacterium]